MIKLYTSRVSYGGPGRMDITIKSSKTPEEKALAPDDWDMVMGVKKGRITWEAYSLWYRALIFSRIRTDFAPFLSILDNDTIVLCCYCTDHEHCHRTLAVKALIYAAEQIGFEIEYMGEIDNAAETGS